MDAEPIQSFQELLAYAARFRDERDWRKFHTPKNLAAAIAIEAAELQEVLLWSDESGSGIDANTRRRLEEELADVLIHCANFALAVGIDIPSALAAKLAENRAKYPVEKSHGNATKYTDL